MKDITSYITEYVSSGRGNNGFKYDSDGYPAKRTDLDTIIDFLENSGYKLCARDLSYKSMDDLCKKMCRLCRRKNQKIYWIDSYVSDKETWNIVFSYPPNKKSDLECMFRINTSDSIPDTYDSYDPNNPLGSYIWDSDDDSVYFYGYKTIKELLQESESKSWFQS